MVAILAEPIDTAEVKERLAKNPTSAVKPNLTQVSIYFNDAGEPQYLYLFADGTSLNTHPIGVDGEAAIEDGRIKGRASMTEVREHPMGSYKFDVRFDAEMVVTD